MIRNLIVNKIVGDAKVLLFIGMKAKLCKRFTNWNQIVKHCKDDMAKWGVYCTVSLSND